MDGVGRRSQAQLSMLGIRVQDGPSACPRLVYCAALC